MALLPVNKIDKGAVNAAATALDPLTTTLSTETDFSGPIIATLCTTASTCCHALRTAHNTLTAEKSRLEKDMFTDPLVQSTLSLACPNPNPSAPSFPTRVKANIDAALALYSSGQALLQAFEDDLRREWDAVSRLHTGKRRNYVWLARDRLVAIVGFNEGLREEVLQETRGLESEIKELEGRLRKGEQSDEGDVVVVEREG